jgi:hypothetical protein
MSLNVLPDDDVEVGVFVEVGVLVGVAVFVAVGVFVAVAVAVAPVLVPVGVAVVPVPPPPHPTSGISNARANTRAIHARTTRDLCISCSPFYLLF